MPDEIALLEAAVFTLAGAAATLITALFSPLKGFFAVAWRMWLWGSVGFIIGNVVLVSLLMPFLDDAGIAGGAPRSTDVLGLALKGLTLFGPFLFSTIGVAVGCSYGWHLAQRRMARAPNNRWRGP